MQPPPSLFSLNKLFIDAWITPGLSASFTLSLQMSSSPHLEYPITHLISSLKPRSKIPRHCHNPTYSISSQILRLDSTFSHKQARTHTPYQASQILFSSVSLPFVISHASPYVKVLEPRQTRYRPGITPLTWCRSMLKSKVTQQSVCPRVCV